MEVNPSLMQERDAEQTIAIGCSLIRSAFGMYLPARSHSPGPCVAADADC